MAHNIILTQRSDICHLQPPPAPRMRSKIDSLIFMSDTGKATKLEETVAANADPKSDVHKISTNEADKEIEVEVEVENVERPVDLYKVFACSVKL